MLRHVSPDDDRGDRGQRRHLRDDVDRRIEHASPDPDAGAMPDGELWVVSEKGGAPVRLDTVTNPGAAS